MRSRTSSLAALLGLICVLALVVVASADAKPVTGPPIVKGSKYLALGDSVTFGYEEPQVTPPPDYNNANSFIAYPEMIGQQLRLKVANAACPGETTSSFINVKAPSNGCESAPNNGPAYRKLFPLHVKYGGSQLAYAVNYLRTNRNVRLVSLMTGANDLFLCQEQTSDGCLSGGEEQATFAKVSSNVRKILSAIRNKASYRGQIVLVNYYSLDYSSPQVNAIVSALNKAIDKPGKRFGALIANGFAEFQNGSRTFGGNPCKAGLLTSLSTGSCGVHPSYSGQALLGQAVLKAARS